MTNEVGVLHFVGIFILGFVLGSIPCGLWVVQAMHGIDIRDYGSKNIGTTNVFRTVGTKTALVVMAGDMLKGIIPVAIAHYFFNNPLLDVTAAAGAFMGHSYSLFLGFKGGKSVATGLGVLVFMMPKVSLAVFLVWLVLVLATRYVSLGSIVAALMTPVFAWYFDCPTSYVWFAAVAGILVVVRHKDNIHRLLSGTESKIKPGNITNIKK